MRGCVRGARACVRARAPLAAICRAACHPRRRAPNLQPRASRLSPPRRPEKHVKAMCARGRDHSRAQAMAMASARVEHPARLHGGGPELRTSTSLTMTFCSLTSMPKPLA
eukprot:4932986-Pleurochrysis_carterae.AAC.3